MSKGGKIALIITFVVILFAAIVWAFKHSGHNFGGGNNPLIKQRMINIQKRK